MNDCASRWSNLLPAIARVVEHQAMAALAAVVRLWDNDINAYHDSNPLFMLLSVFRALAYDRRVHAQIDDCLIVPSMLPPVSTRRIREAASEVSI